MESSKKCTEIETYSCSITNEYHAFFHVPNNGPSLHVWADSEEEAYSQMAEKLMQRRTDLHFLDDA